MQHIRSDGISAGTPSKGRANFLIAVCKLSPCVSCDPYLIDLAGLASLICKKDCVQLPRYRYFVGLDRYSRCVATLHGIAHLGSSPIRDF